MSNHEVAGVHSGGQPRSTRQVSSMSYTMSTTAQAQADADVSFGQLGSPTTCLTVLVECDLREAWRSLQRGLRNLL